MKNLRRLLIIGLVISMLLMGNTYIIEVFAANSDVEIVILTEELYENRIKGNENIIPVFYDRCSPYTSNIALLTNDETEPCWHPAFQDPSTGNEYGFLMTHYVREITTPNGSTVHVNEHTDELPDWYINAISNYSNTLEIFATKIDEPTIYYNCHSYAWYSQNTYYNYYWMGDPSTYYQDNSYIEVTMPREGDIICYFDNMGTTNQSDDLNLHSGIVLEYDPTITSNNICGISNQITVLSKWGPAGLYEHQGDCCPYTSNYDGDADYIKFYRPRTESAHQLNSEMTDLSLSKSVSSNNGIQNTYSMYELNVTQTSYYEFIVSSNSEMNILLYDEHMQEFCTLNYEEISNVYTFALDLPCGIYYLRNEYSDETHNGTISVKVKYHDEHTYIYTSVDSTYHVGECVHCGYETDESMHMWRDYSSTHVVCRDCGLLKRQSGFTPIIKGLVLHPETE